MNRLYSNVADVLYDISFVHIKCLFAKFSWSQELNILKESSAALVRFWKVGGRRGRTIKILMLKQKKLNVTGKKIIVIEMTFKKLY